MLAKYLGLNLYSKLTILLFLLIFPSVIASAQNTVVKGKVTDAITGSAIEFATVRFDKTTVGGLTDEGGNFTLVNRGNQTKVVVSLMGYEDYITDVEVGKTTNLNIKLKGDGVQLSEVVVRRGKEKYTKKNNPAVELIKKVIDHKYNNIISDENYYTYSDYDRILFALNEYKEDKGLLKNMKFLSKYADSSLIDNKRILPFSVRETMSDVYYRKNPEGTRRVIKAYQNEGLDQNFDTEPIDAVIKEVFKDINIRDNNIEMLFKDFVGPLSTHSSVSFYKWYIIDTLDIDNKSYINLGFVPFNPRDVGFIGNIYVRADSSYAVKQVSFRVPTKINVNFVQEMLITQEFEEIQPKLWAPKKFTMAMDMSLYGVTKFYVQKEQSFSNFIFNIPVDAVFKNPSPIIYLTDYNGHNSEYWNDKRPKSVNKDYNMDQMIAEFRSNKLINFAMNAVNVMLTGYIPINNDDTKNKLDIGNTLTFYSYNPLEGNRLRLTLSTTSHLHPHLFLYGYGAYGTRDGKFKYYGEATWAFNKPKYHKDEYPKNNLSIGYKYDVNALGQQFLQAERDNIFMSLRPKKYDNLTYDRRFEISYTKENYSGFSSNFFARTSHQEAAGGLKIEKQDDLGNLIDIRKYKTTEVGFTLRYAPHEKFMQQRRRRYPLPSKDVIITLSHTSGLKNVFGSEYAYNKSSLGLDKMFWIAPFGKLALNIKGEKVWGRAPFPALLSANANNSATIQRGSFYMLRPLEFLNDQQVVWDVNYRMGGWFFNRIPFIKALKWREVFGFRGMWGSLSDKNNPTLNHQQLIFPSNTYSMGRDPYMEYSVGIENIFQFFRIDYVRRMNYLDNADIDKHGFRISFDMTF